MTDVYNSMNDLNDKENILKYLQVNSEIMQKQDPIQYLCIVYLQI